MSVHQNIMNKVFNRVNTEGFHNVMRGLEGKEALAVFTGNLNYQVGNGGLTQWHYNGYSQYIEKLIEALKPYKAQYTSVLEVTDMLLKVNSYIEDESIDEMPNLDNMYNRVSGQFLEDIETILKGSDA